MYYCPKRVEIPVVGTQQQLKESRCTKCKAIHDPGTPCSVNNGGMTVGAHKCPICEATCNTSAELRKHMETHSGVKAFRCSICRYKGNTLRYVFILMAFSTRILLIFHYFFRGMRTHIRMHFDKKTSDFNEENYISCILEEDGVEVPTPAAAATAAAAAAAAAALVIANTAAPPSPGLLALPNVETGLQLHYCDICNYSSSFKGNVVC